MKTTHTYTFAAPADAVARVMTDTAFHLEVDRQRDDVRPEQCAIRDVSERGDTKTFVLETAEFERSKTGRIDRRKVVPGRTDFTWNGHDRTLTWVYTPGQEATRIDVRGKYTVREDGPDRTRLIHDYSIDIRIPLIGGQIAKIVDREFKESFVRFEATVKKHLER